MRALIVDDNVDIRLLLERVLSMSGFDVVQADGGPEALALLSRGEAPDVVVLDVQMPLMDGWSTLLAIRHDSLHPDVPVIMCTVKGSLDNVARGWELGCDAYVGKPFDVRELMTTIHDVVERDPATRASVRASALADARRALTVGKR